MRLFVDAAAFLKLSSACNFFDVVSAFATLLRRIVFDIDLGDQAWLAGLKHASVSDAEVECIYDQIKSCKWVDSFSSSSPICDNSHSYGLAKQWYINTWASHEFIPSVLHSTAGQESLIWGLLVKGLQGHCGKEIYVWSPGGCADQMHEHIESPMELLDSVSPDRQSIKKGTPRQLHISSPTLASPLGAYCPESMYCQRSVSRSL